MINVDLAIFQPYLDLEAGDNQSLKIQVARPGIEPRSSCSSSQELNHSATATPQRFQRRGGKCISQWEARAAILFFPISMKNTNLVEDDEIFLPVKFCWIRLSGFRGEVENVSANQRPGRPSCFSDQPEKHKTGRGRWGLASCQVSLNSVQWFQRRSRKCEKLTMDHGGTTDGRTDDGQCVITIVHSSLWLRCTKKLFKYNTQICPENMQELMTYLVHYQTGSWHNTEYDWPKLMTIKLISKTCQI